MNSVLREEKKYRLNAVEASLLRGKLNAALHADVHNGSTGYLVRSLYFDTPYARDLEEKLAGIETRRKVRLRTYDPGADFAMLEIKQKTGALQQKRSLRVSREEADEIRKGNLDVLLSHREPFAAECYSLMMSECYRPVTVIEYDRSAWVLPENRIRITTDRGVRACETNLDLFAPDLAFRPVLDPFLEILEVKYNGFLLSYVKEMLAAVDKTEQSVSKYALARQSL